MEEGKSKVINSPGDVNSHWRVQIGSAHDKPHGQAGSGAFVAPQYTIDSLKFLWVTRRHHITVEQSKSISIEGL